MYWIGPRLWLWLILQCTVSGRRSLSLLLVLSLKFCFDLFDVFLVFFHPVYYHLNLVQPCIDLASFARSKFDKEDQCHAWSRSGKWQWHLKVCSFCTSHFLVFQRGWRQSSCCCGTMFRGTVGQRRSAKRLYFSCNVWQHCCQLSQWSFSIYTCIAINNDYIHYICIYVINDISPKIWGSSNLFFE